VVLPEYIPRAWWQHILHGQTAQFLKLALLFRPGFVVVSVPFHSNGARAAPQGPAPEPVPELASANSRPHGRGA